MSLKSVSKAALLLGALANLTACMSTTAMYSEAAWQTLNVVDVGQTVTIARQPTVWRELGFDTRNVIGAHPSTKAVYEYMVSAALAHGAVTFLLDRADPGSGPWHTASLLWQGSTLGAKGYYVANNFSIGIDPWEGGPPAPRKVVPLPVMR